MPIAPSSPPQGSADPDYELHVASRIGIQADDGVSADDGAQADDGPTPTPEVSTEAAFVPGSQYSQKAQLFVDPSRAHLSSAYTVSDIMLCSNLPMQPA